MIKMKTNIIRGLQKYNPLKKVYDLLLNTLKKILMYYIIIITKLPSGFIMKNKNILFSMILINIITILLINNIFQTYIPNILLFEFIFNISIYDLLLLIAPISSTYIKFNLILITINTIKMLLKNNLDSLMKIKKYLLGYMIKNISHVVIGSNIILRIDGLYSNSPLYIVYAFASLIIALVLSIHYSQIKVKEFKIEEFDKNIENENISFLNKSLSYVHILVLIYNMIIFTQKGLLYDGQIRPEPRITAENTPGMEAEMQMEEMTTGVVIVGEGEDPLPSRQNLNQVEEEYDDSNSTQNPVFIYGQEPVASTSDSNQPVASTSEYRPPRYLESNRNPGHSEITVWRIPNEPNEPADRLIRQDPSTHITVTATLESHPDTITQTIITQEEETYMNEALEDHVERVISQTETDESTENNSALERPITPAQSSHSASPPESTGPSTPRSTYSDF